MTDPKDLLNKEVDAKPTMKRSETAFKLEQEVKGIRHKVGESFLELGRLLKEFRDNAYYKDLNYDTMTDWLSSPDISISIGWAWNFISVYEIFILEHGLSPARVLGADYSKLQEIIPIVRKAPDSAEEWLEKATDLRRVDLRREIQEFKGLDEHDVAERSVAHLPVSRILHWIKMLKLFREDNEKVILETLEEELDGEIKKATGLMDISKLK